MTSTRQAFWIVAILLTLTIAASNATEHRTLESLTAPLESIPRQIDGWSMMRSQVLDDRTLGILAPTSYLSRTYMRDGRQLDLFVAYYAAQRAGESMHSPKNCLPGSGWEIWRQDSATVPVNGELTQINRYSIQRLGQKQIVFYWYQSSKRVIASEFLGKILLVRDSLVDGRTAGTIVRIALPATDAAAAEGTAFSERMIRELQRCLGRQNSGNPKS
jgi:EpsI family protein